MRAIRTRQALLFVGAGVSVDLDLPSWPGLVAHIARELEYDPDIFDGPNANYLTLAEYYKIEKGAIGPLRSWMDVNWNTTDDRIQESQVHQLILDLNFPIIYTTNYDRILERAFGLAGRKYSKVVDVRDIARVASDSVQIVKFHGDFDNDQSIVLTETDYYDRLSFESPLDIKLRSDALARPILFVGYSLSDVNIRLLLHKLWRTWQASGHEKERPKSYIFLSRPDPIQKAVLGRWGIEVVSHETIDHPGDALCQFLEDLKKQAAAL